MKINGVGRKRNLLFVNKKKQKKFINKSFLLLFFKKGRLPSFRCGSIA